MFQLQLDRTRGKKLLVARRGPRIGHDMRRRYMDERPTDNEVRPHQALFGYPPAVVHHCGNKTRLLEDYRNNFEKAKQRRMKERLLNNQKPTTFSCKNV